MHGGQFGGVVVVVHEHGVGAGRGRRLELRVVPDQQHLRPGFGGKGGDAVEGEGAGHRRLIDDDELSLAERLPGALVNLPPLRRVLRGDPEVIGEDLRRDGGRGEADHAAAPVLPRPP